jgi:hypothetical protein
MDDLHHAVNKGISAAVNRAGSGRVAFVPTDAAFEGHCFWEEGVAEPQKQGEDRSNTYFLQLKSPVGSLTKSDEYTWAAPGGAFCGPAQSFKATYPDT